ncbi:MAG TPA: UDP-N-acetylmuramoyl-L-alanine--D-glutamate ligase, partial [Patescibacteria group bacterium]|nr:UDP-N-acetylmuramoyl-L-alanine--D-glutamate ligase [Patescibacteria group bacterium]
MKYSDKQREIFQGKKIAIVGLGVEGLASAEFLKQFQPTLAFFDQKEASELDAENVNKAQSLGKVVTGQDAFAHVLGFDLILRSPGIKKEEEFLVKAQEKGAVVTSQTKLFFDFCPCYIIGVTGTKGKGTTATLIHKMLQESGRDTYLGGNIGVPPFSFLDKLTESSIVVLELSSFQLADVTKSPHIAVMLMVVPEHLDYHGHEAAYVDAKRNILRFQTQDDIAILNRDYIASNESDIYTQGQIFWVTRERASIDQGCYIKDGAIWMSMRGSEWKIIDTDKIALPGKHNWENASSAALAATLSGADKEAVVKVLQSFTGLPHRIELVREVKGVRYYDDSIATNPESAIAAIESFESPKILILGGVTEGSSFEQLGEIIAKESTIKAIIGIGKEWPTIKAAIEKNKPFEHLLFIEGATTMQQVVQAASKVAESGDVVLLSPACKSFDMFKNYKERGDKFKKEV